MWLQDSFQHRGSVSIYLSPCFEKGFRDVGLGTPRFIHAFELIITFLTTILNQNAGCLILCMRSHTGVTADVSRNWSL